MNTNKNNEMENNTTTTVTKISETNVITFLKSDAVKKSLAQACSTATNPQRLLRVACAAVSRQPMLQQCTRESLFLCLTNSAQLGLEPNLVGSCFYVPFRNKNGVYEAQFIVGYRGLIELARRSGEILSIEAHVVYQKDEFRYELGLSPELKHIPYLGEDDPGQIVFAYAIAVLKEGTRQVEVMTRREIDGIRNRSKAGNFGAWVTDYSEMARKTVVRRICKYLPLTSDFYDAIEIDEDKIDTENSINVEIEKTSKKNEKPSFLADSKQN